MSTLNINLTNVQPLDTILTGLSGLAYSGNQGLFIKVNATADGFEFAAGSGGVPYTGATQDVNLGEYELKAGQIEYDQTPTGAAGVAITRWNDSIGTLETTLKGGNVVLKHGRDLFERVVNKTGIQLTKAAYQAVRVSTAQGQRLGVALAQANNDNNSADTIGLVVETIDNNQEGMIYVVGEIDGINTTGSLQSETWVDGDVLYLSPTTAGRITNVKPVAPQHLVVIGYVVYAHATQGKIYVKVNNGFELGELHDVDTTGATNGQVLKFNGTIWTAQTDLNSGVWGSITGTLSSQTDLQSALDGKVDENAAITGATKTKITYDAKGLVTSGADATTADIADSSNKRYVTDAQLTVIGNTSGTNSGNQTLANTSDATSHTVTLSATGGSVQLVEGSGITLTTTGTAADGIITIASSGGGGSTFADNVFEIYDNTDNTKKLAFEASGITTGTTRTLTVPNASGTIALTSDLASYVPYTGATGAVNLGANNLTVDTNVFFVDATNNRVGLGTASPNNTLTVSNNGTSYSTAGFITQFYQGTTNTDVKIMMADASNFISITYGGTAVSNTQWAGFTMGSGNAPFRVWGSDNIGIGYTNGNLVTNKFQVSGNSRIDGLLRFFTDTSAAVALKRSGTALQIRLADDSGYAPLESASVSINTTVANYKLNIYDSANGARMGFYNASTGTTTSDGMFVGLDDGLSGSWWNFENGYIRYGTNNTERMRITGAGLVAIGNTAPSAILHANSSGGATDLFRVDLAGVRRFRITSGGTVTLISNNTGFYEGASTGFDFSNTSAPAATQSAYNFYGRQSTNSTGESTHFDMGGKNIAATTGFARASGTGTWIGARLDYTINNTGTYSGTVTGFYLNATETSITGTTHNLLNLLIGGSSRFRVDNSGKITFDSTITAGGTTGNQTINKPSGTVNIAAAGTDVTVTNNLVTTSSIVMAVVRTNDTTAYIKNVVPSAGSFVIKLGAAATAEVSIGFIVNN
jgi:hypothetical protein